METFTSNVYDSIETILRLFELHIYVLDQVKLKGRNRMTSRRTDGQKKTDSGFYTAINEKCIMCFILSLA